MLETVNEKITELIALYEGEKQRASELEKRLQASGKALAESREETASLRREVDNLKVQGIFAPDGNALLAKNRLDRMIRDIDRCIAALEK